VLRAIEHRDVMFDQALNVVVSYGPVGGRPVNGQPRTDAAVTVHNQGTRPISDVRVRVFTQCGRHVGDDSLDLLQSRMMITFRFDLEGDMFDRGERAGTNSLALNVTLYFRDIDGTTWVRHPRGALDRVTKKADLAALAASETGSSIATATEPANESRTDTVELEE
jgi:hypothetical protein